MNIGFSGLRYNYYDPKKGSSFEYENFYTSLKNLPGVNVRYFPFEKILESGREKFNLEILDWAKSEKPDLLFVFMLSDEFDKRTLEELKKHTATVAWFADDSWRFYNYSKFWAPRFSWAITTYSWMPEIYKKYGQPNVIRSQWAANLNTYKPPAELPKERPAVTFIGGWSKPREKIITYLRNRGIPVTVFGGGWNEGRVSDEEMIRLFSVSKINLGLNPAPGFLNKNSLGRLFFRRSIDKIIPDFHLISNFQTFFRRNVPQIKARHFEIPACRGLVITSPADDLDQFYEPDKEMVFYSHLDELASKINYYLEHDNERERIAEAGYQKTLRFHSYEKRFQEIFKSIGFGL